MAGVGHERKRGTTHLDVDCFLKASLAAWDLDGLPELLESTEFRIVVGQGDCSVTVEGDVAVVAADANVCNTNLCVLCPTNFDTI